jgi:hypothetical protein
MLDLVPASESHIGDDNMRNQDDYRHHAAELVKLAKRAATSSDKGWLMLSAEAWLDLADGFDRRSERRALPLDLMGWFSRLGYLKSSTVKPASSLARAFEQPSTVTST